MSRRQYHIGRHLLRILCNLRPRLQSFYDGSVPLTPRAFFLALVVFAVAGCTELPNDIGVHQHRATAAQTRAASLHPIFASWFDDPTAKGQDKIVIDLTLQQAFFYRGKTLIGRTNISSGRREFETPPGKYRVIQKDANHVSSQSRRIRLAPDGRRPPARCRPEQ